MMLKSHSDDSPLDIVLPGVSIRALQSVLDFLYNGSTICSSNSIGETLDLLATLKVDCRDSFDISALHSSSEIIDSHVTKVDVEPYSLFCEADNSYPPGSDSIGLNNKTDVKDLLFKEILGSSMVQQSNLNTIEDSGNLIAHEPPLFDYIDDGSRPILESSSEDPVHHLTATNTSKFARRRRQFLPRPPKTQQKPMKVQTANRGITIPKSYNLRIRKPVPQNDNISEIELIKNECNKIIDDGMESPMDEDNTEILTESDNDEDFTPNSNLLSHSPECKEFVLKQPKHAPRHKSRHDRPDSDKPSTVLIQLRKESMFDQKVTIALPQIFTNVVIADDSLICNVCKGTFSDIESFNFHCQNCGSKRARDWWQIVKCGYCSIYFLGGTRLVIHQSKVHNVSRSRPRYQCHDCKEVFKSMRPLEEHRRFHTYGRKTYLCRICSQVFLSKNEVNCHRHKVHGNDTCRFCRNVVSEPMKDHEDSCQAKHDVFSIGLPRDTPPISGEPAEDVGFSPKGVVVKYERNKSVRCKICDKVVLNCNFVRHNIFSHGLSKEHAYECSLCSRGYRKAFLLELHMKMHKNVQKIFHCKHCEQSFPTESQRSSHYDKCHPDAEEVCSYCKELVKRSYLTEHKANTSINWSMDLFHGKSKRQKQRDVSKQVQCVQERLIDSSYHFDSACAQVTSEHLNESSSESGLQFQDGVSDTSSDISNDVGLPDFNFEEIYADESDSSSDSESEGVGLDDLCTYNESVEDKSVVSSFKNALRQWALNHKITLHALSDLLKVINLEYLDTGLPNDGRTLLQTYLLSKDLSVVPMGSGKFCYIGLEKNIVKQIRKFSCPSGAVFSLAINIDGLPIFKSTGVQFWPILAYIRELEVKRPFVVGIYCGPGKPVLGEFLNPFVKELSSLCANGIKFEGKSFQIKLSGPFICDRPARDFVKCGRSHMSYDGCDRCEDHGEYHGYVTFQDVSAALRTDAKFRLDAEKNPNATPLLMLTPPIDLVGDFVCDPMHLLHLGVMKRLLLALLRGPLHVKVGKRHKKEMSDTLRSLSRFCPREFSRKTRGLEEVDRFKASEFRVLLLYAGIVVFRSVLRRDLYEHFLIFHASVYILSHPHYCLDNEMLDFVETLLVNFVASAATAYGKAFVSYNVHALIHVVSDVRRFRCPLDDISAYPFENYLGNIKRLLRTPNRPLEQVIRRICELEQLEDNLPELERTRVCLRPRAHESVDLTPLDLDVVERYKSVTFKNVLYSSKVGDNCCMHGRTVIEICDIVKCRNEDIVVVGHAFQDIEDFYTYPFNSSRLGIYKVKSPSSSSVFYCCKIEDVVKCVLFPYKERFVSIVLLHTS